jgi:hypothetical protein
MGSQRGRIMQSQRGDRNLEGMQWIARSDGRSEAGTIRRSPPKRSRRWTAALVLALVFANASPMLADEYDSTEAGNPVRIAAYVLHPVGVLLDYLLLRPAHWLVSHEPLKTVFGHED